MHLDNIKETIDKAIKAALDSKIIESEAPFYALYVNPRICHVER